jgi:hypothetical protein
MLDVRQHLVQIQYSVDRSERWPAHEYIGTVFGDHLTCDGRTYRPVGLTE